MSILNYISEYILFIPKLLGRYIVWHVTFIDNAYKNNIWRLNGHLFCALFNIRAFVRRKSIRFRYSPIDVNYLAESDGHYRFFNSKFTNLIAYSNGLKQRGKEIGEVYFLPCIQFKNGDRVIDCGANVGDLKLYFDIQGLDIDYIGIEPSPGEYECLEKNISPNNAYNFGLWNEDSTLVFYISSHNGDSSYIKPINYTHERQIPTKRLDTFISGHVKLLKIEAEGAEPEVLLGCENLLPEIEYISADLGFERGIHSECTLPQVTNYLLERGFELVEVGQPRLVALFRNRKLCDQDPN